MEQLAVCLLAVLGRLEWKSSQKIHNFCVRFPDLEGRIEVSVESEAIQGTTQNNFIGTPTVQVSGRSAGLGGTCA